MYNSISRIMCITSQNNKRRFTVWYTNKYKKHKKLMS